MGHTVTKRVFHTWNLILEFFLEWALVTLCTIKKLMKYELETSTRLELK
jgi:hypothetical protein